jgi:hypothetical protein
MKIFTFLYLQVFGYQCMQFFIEGYDALFITLA